MIWHIMTGGCYGLVCDLESICQHRSCATLFGAGGHDQCIKDALLERDSSFLQMYE